MFPIRITVPLLAGLCLLILVPDATAFGRRRSARTNCYIPDARPCVPCHPAFTLHARWYEGNGFVPWSPDRAVRLPIELGVTNREDYTWGYTNEEYGFFLFDDRGCYIPNALQVNTDIRCITIIPGATRLDTPGVNVNPRVLQLGKQYTLLVTLRGRAACAHFTPVVFSDGKG